MPALSAPSLTLPSPWRASALVCLGLAFLTFAVFGQAIGFGFINLDDNLYVDRNPMLEAGLSLRGLHWAFTANLTHLTGSAEYWEPLTLLSRLADYQMFGFRPGGHHFTSILVHLAAGLALFGALQKLTGAFWRSAIVAALFLLHPMHVEPVVWLSARKDLMSGLFYILTLWAYAWYRGQPSFARYSGLFAIFLCANMAKPMAVSLPLVMLLLDFWPLNQVRPRDRGWIMRAVLLAYQKAPFIVVSVAVSALAVHVQRSIGAMADDALLPLGWRIGAALVSIATYLLKAFVPFDLAIFYPHPGRNLPIWQAVVAGLALLTLSLAALWQLRPRPWLPVGWFWFLAVLAPVCGIVQVGDQAMADRYSYLAFIGLFIAVVWQIAEWRRLPVVAAIAVGAAALLAFQQVQTWRSNEAVFSHAIAVTKENHVAHFNLGAALWEAGRREEAWQHMTEAGRIRRNFLTYQLTAADGALARGAFAEAIPRLVRVLMLLPWDQTLRLKLGAIFVRNGEPGKALIQFAEALKYQPQAIAPRLAIAEVLLSLHEPLRAEPYLREVLRVEPMNARARDLLETTRAAPERATLSSPPAGD